MSSWPQIVSGYRSVSQASFSSPGGIAREMKSNRRSLLGYSSRVIAHHPTDRCQLTAKELLRQTEQVTGQMATWREWRAWRREFKSLGIRQVKEREARSIWHEEKQQSARWWLREQELLPYVITALATLIVGLIAWLK